MTKPVDEDVSASETPAGWGHRPVREMGSVLAGKALNVNGAGPLRPYLRTKNVLDGRIDIQDVLWMPMTDSEFERFRVVSGDVLLNEGQSLELVGRCSIYHDEFGAPCAMQNQLLRFRARTGTCADFAAHLFRRCQQSGSFSTVATQTTSVAHLGSSRFGTLNLLWPNDASEQQAIADALTDVDSMVVALERLIAKKQAIKQGMMQQFLTGRVHLRGFADPWLRVSLGNISAFITKGATPTTYGFRWESTGVPFLRSECVSEHGLDMTHSMFISTAANQALRRSQVMDGDILMTITGYVGRVTRLTGIGRANINQHIARVRVQNEQFDAGFVYHLLSQPAMRDYYQSIVTGQAYPQISLRQVRETVIPSPPVDEQRAIGEALDDTDAELAALQGRLTKARCVKQGMMQQLLTGRTRLPVQETAA